MSGGNGSKDTASDARPVAIVLKRETASGPGYKVQVVVEEFEGRTKEQIADELLVIATCFANEAREMLGE